MSSEHQREDVSSLANSGASATRIPLSAFDGQRMAVELGRGRERVVVRGTAKFVRDDVVGNTLRIQLDDGGPGNPVVVVSEHEWMGRIVPDFHHGCDFCLTAN